MQYRMWPEVRGHRRHSKTLEASLRVQFLHIRSFIALFPLSGSVRYAILGVSIVNAAHTTEPNRSIQGPASDVGP